MSLSTTISTKHNTSPITPYVYQIVVAGYGATAAMAIISPTTAEYWNGVDQLVFGEHILGNGNSVNVDLNGCVIDPYIDYTYRSVKGPELHEQMAVAAFSENEGGQVWGIYVEDIDDLRFNSLYDQTFFGIAEEDGCYAVGRTFEAISNEYRLCTSQPFDSDLLELQFVWFSGAEILKSVRYDGVPLELQHQCSEVLKPAMATLLDKTVH